MCPITEIRAPSSGRYCLVVKVADSWLKCPVFELSTLEDPPCRGRLTLNISRLKRPPVGVVRNLREGGASSGVVLVT
ncbi:hypothetical protein TNCV_26261 [Trichonephila clavipes]|uniref:Uncharacterized protein n=1 Tax=Trichonephila clavipes TaxID=2585209 RepID=A0A8X6W1S5_TRICX|nr:hypothetical protein TNCV_26261 [Trichonephila clavipes]